MTTSLPPSVERLIEEFGRLPGIGPKSASRLVFYLLTKPETDVAGLAEAVGGLRAGLVTCATCFTVAIASPCHTCTDPQRDSTVLAVVEEPLDVLALDRSGFTGQFHVLGGVISPIDGIGPDQLRVQQLVDRLSAPRQAITEVILATNPSLEGEATALHVKQRLSELRQSREELAGLTITRIARGLPMGSDLEYADDVTIQRSLEGRRVIE